MYKIYINDTPLILEGATVDTKPVIKNDELVAFYPGKKKFLLNYIDLLEKVQHYRYIKLYHPNVEKMYRDFSSHFKIIEAAGGLVFNRDKELLVIYRRGSWDLPKGKIDSEESKEAAAVREVREETGLKQLALGAYLGLTLHTYKDQKDRRVLKQTHWFEMATPEYQLKPQTEEDIETAIWEHPGAFLKGEKTMYGTIRDIITSLVN